MINQYEVYVYLKDTFPEICGQLTEDCRYNIYASVQALLDYTTNNIKQRKLKDVKKCFALAERLFLKGNKLVKNAVSNIYIYSFSRLANFSKDGKDKIWGLIPGTLYTEFLRQTQVSCP